MYSTRATHAGNNTEHNNDINTSSTAQNPMAMSSKCTAPPINEAESTIPQKMHRRPEKLLPSPLRPNHRRPDTGSENIKKMNDLTVISLEILVLQSRPRRLGNADPISYNPRRSVEAEPQLLRAAAKFIESGEGETAYGMTIYGTEVGCWILERRVGNQAVALRAIPFFGGHQAYLRDGYNVAHSELAHFISAFLVEVRGENM